MAASVHGRELNGGKGTASTSRRFSVYFIVVLATFGASNLMPSFSTLLERTAAPGGGMLQDLLVLALPAAGAILWALFVRWVTLALFTGPRARMHGFASAMLGLVVMLLLVSYQARMAQVAGQEAELIASMGSDGETKEPPDAARLDLRIRDYYHALQSRDAGALYELGRFPPERTRPSLSEYRKERGLSDEWTSRPVTTVDVKRVAVCACNPWTWQDGSRSLRCLILLDAAVGGPGGPQQRRFLETWEYLDGEWYERCPGPAAEACPEDPHAEGYCRPSHVLVDQ